MAIAGDWVLSDESSITDMKGCGLKNGRTV